VTGKSKKNNSNTKQAPTSTSNKNPEITITPQEDYPNQETDSDPIYGQRHYIEQNSIVNVNKAKVYKEFDNLMAYIET